MTDIPEDVMKLARSTAMNCVERPYNAKPVERAAIAIAIALIADRAAQAERMARLEEALKFYADPDIYERRQIGGTFIKPMAMIDKGESARRALSQEGSDANR